MARIPEEQIERLKAEVSLERLAEARGIALKRHGADLIGLCPFHDDHEPSLVISPKKNLWHCLGACQAGGSVIDWVMKAEGVSFRHAVELLQADSPPFAAGSTAGPVKRTTTPKLDNSLPRDAEDIQLLGRVIDFYHETLKASPEALGYLEKRGIACPQVVEHFKLGFANRTLGYRLPTKNRTEGAALRGQLQRIGILRASGHEHFNGSLVIPVMDEAGNVVEVYGRKLNDNLRKGTPKHLYLPGPHAGVWNLQALHSSPEIILCESLIDALTFWCAGYRNVTASYGTEGFTADHLQTFKAHGTERVLIAYDRDAAGEKAAESLVKRLNEESIDAYRLHFPKGMDANAYTCQVTPASKSLGVVIRSAIWMGKGKAEPVTTVAQEPGLMIDTETGELLGEADDKPEPTPEPAPRNAATPLAAESPRFEPATTESLPARAIPPAPAPDVPAEVKDNETLIAFADRRYRIRGLEKNSGFAALKVNLLVSAPSPDATAPAVHVDTLDLYSAKARGGYIKQAAAELGLKEEVIKRDLGQVLLKCEALQEQRLNGGKDKPEALASMSEAERRAALALLQAPDLMSRIVQDFGRCGVVGESSNLLTAYLAAVSRKLDQPLAILIQSTSAAGKSALMEAVLDLMPEEERVQYSAMTGQSLYYLGETELKHKILAIAEEEGMSEAAYALKLLQSQGELTIASTGKDPVSGELRTRQYHVEGPVTILLTTTAIEIDEELKNRCLVLTVNESREQTRAIQDRQRFEETLKGLLTAQDRTTIQTLHHNAQRLLKPLKVVNPYADQLTFLDDRTRTRRDHRKYLVLIRTIALLHQHQRTIRQVRHNGQVIDYIEATPSDIEQANELAHDVLGRTLDELPPQTRRLLGLIHAMVAERCQAQAIAQADDRFSRRQVREATGWGNTQLKIHLHRLVELEYLLIHRAGHAQRHLYELAYDGDPDAQAPHLSGLLDVAHLREYDANRSGFDGNRSASNDNRAGTGRPLVGGWSGAGRGSQKARKPGQDKASIPSAKPGAQKDGNKGKNNGRSYRSGTSEPAPAATPMQARGAD